MAKAKTKLKPIKGLRVLLSNDDGINAPGLKSMEKIARTISDDIWVVAPEFEQSGAGHSLSLHDPLRMRKLGKKRFAVKGTPTDCVLMAVNHIFRDQKMPDLLLSGVNRNGNLAEDVTYSGTVAAAMEGLLAGIPSVAMSQLIQRDHPCKWATAEAHAPELLRKLVDGGWPSNVLININFPDVVADKVTGVEVCKLGHRDLGDMFVDERIDARGTPYFWIGYREVIGKPAPKTDLAVMDKGGISVTPLHMNLTHQPTQAKLAKLLA
jgi:5'-nucleotidase